VSKYYKTFILESISAQVRHVLALNCN